MVAHALNLSTLEAEAEDICKFQASMDYKTSSKTTRATEKSCHEKPKQTSKYINNAV